MAALYNRSASLQNLFEAHLKATFENNSRRIVAMHQIYVAPQYLPLEFMLWFFGLPAASMLIILITLLRRKRRNGQHERQQ